MKKKLVLMTSVLMAVTLLTGCGHNHEWGEVAKGTDWNDGIATDVIHCSNGDVTL